MILPENRYRIGYIPQNQKRKKGRILLVSIVLLIIIVVLVLILVFRKGTEADTRASEITNSSTEQVEPDIAPETLWNNKDYTTLINWALAALEEEPFRKDALLYLGFSSFYQGISQFSQEEQYPLLDAAVINLRRAWLVVDDPALRGQIAYILGKAYYHKGRYYSDLSLRFLQESIQLGYMGDDSLEYAGLAYGELGKFQESLTFFLKAAETNPSDILFLTIGQTYDKIGESDKALAFLQRTIELSEDIELEVKSRYILGKIFKEKGDLELAIEQYEEILDLDKRSADAHFFLGEIYDMSNNNVKARAEWRKTLEIDPSHYGALTKLY